MPFSSGRIALFPDLLNLHDTELADSINSKQMGIAKTSPDKVGVFHFSADCVVVRFDSRTPESFNSREMLIKRPVRALIAVIKGEIARWVLLLQEFDLQVIATKGALRTSQRSSCPDWETRMKKS
ncbi:hypothetical protein Tco_0178660 [Tanacetum coccineum]